MFYGSSIWDPKLIVAQIVAMQCVFYLSLGILLLFLLGLTGQLVNLTYILDARTMRVSTLAGWVVMIAYILNAGICAVALSRVVERAKKCLDFTCTAVAVHFFLCVFYAGFPYVWEWWIIVGVFVVAATVVGEYLCMRQELREIPLGR